MNNNKVRILIIGVGGIGRHHLYSLLDKKFHNNIEEFIIVDSKPSFLPCSNNFSLFDDLKKVDHTKTFDIVLINTKSDNRFEVLDFCLKSFLCKSIYLEKLLFRNIIDYDKASKLTEHNIKMWTSVRLQPLYNIPLNDYVKEVVVTVPKGSLITDVIHYVDHYFQADKISDIDFESINLSDKYFPSKRSGNLELEGSMKFRSKSTNRVMLIKSCDSSTNYTAELSSEDGITIIDDNNSRIEYINNDGNSKMQKQRMLLQSELTGQIVLDGGKSLIGLDRAIDLHKLIYFKILSDVASLAKFRSISQIPFT